MAAAAFSLLGIFSFVCVFTFDGLFIICDLCVKQTDKAALVERRLPPPSARWQRRPSLPELHPRLSDAAL